jgi:hypothetical protein
LLIERRINFNFSPIHDGLAFETFLKNLFDAFGLEAREPFAFEEGK